MAYFSPSPRLSKRIRRIGTQGRGAPAVPGEVRPRRDDPRGARLLRAAAQGRGAHLGVPAVPAAHQADRARRRGLSRQRQLRRAQPLHQPRDRALHRGRGAGAAADASTSTSLLPAAEEITPEIHAQRATWWNRMRWRLALLPGRGDRLHGQPPLQPDSLGRGNHALAGRFTGHDLPHPAVRRRRRVRADRLFADLPRTSAEPAPLGRRRPIPGSRRRLRQALTAEDIEGAALTGELACSFSEPGAEAALLVAMADVTDEARAEGVLRLGPSALRLRADRDWAGSTPWSTAPASPAAISRPA